jgi:hypothetical protein
MYLAVFQACAIQRCLPPDQFIEAMTERLVEEITAELEAEA